MKREFDISGIGPLEMVKAMFWLQNLKAASEPDFEGLLDEACEYASAFHDLTPAEVREHFLSGATGGSQLDVVAYVLALGLRYKVEEFLNRHKN